MGAFLLEGASGGEGVGAGVVAFVLAVEVPGPVGVEVAVGEQGAELEDGFGGAGAPAGSGDVHAVLAWWRQAPSMTPAEMGHPFASAWG